MFSVFHKINKWAKIYFLRYLNMMDPRNNPRIFKNRSDIVYLGWCSYHRQIFVKGKPYLKKVFINTKTGILGCRNEKKATELLSTYSWSVPFVKNGLNSFTAPYYPIGCQLDLVAKHLDRNEQLQVAGQILGVILDLHLEGVAHRDFRANNLMLIDNQIKVLDFEYLTAYPNGSNPKFEEHYDITGKGLPHPENCNHMCFVSKAPDSISQALTVTLEDAMGQLGKLLKRRLIGASCSFKTYHDGRRITESKVYGSFKLSNFEITPEEALRNTELRLNKMGIRREQIEGRSVIDLGCNTGAMLFQINKFMPKKSIGVEYDYYKVKIATQIVAFSGLKNLNFICRDVDFLRSEEMGSSFDVVLCLALEEHVRDQQKLFQLLSKLTSGVLYYEGTSKDYISEKEKRLFIEKSLYSVGFRSIEYLGLCTDDRSPKLNNRPLFRACK